LLNHGVIRPSTSPCGSPIVLVPEKDGTWRMCVNFQALNKIIVKNHYPHPRIDDLFYQLNIVVYFTKLILRSGYLQIIIVEGDIWKISFKTKHNLVEWLDVMPFGLCNTLETCMRVTNDLFIPYIDDFFIVYLDDILILNRTWEYHLMHVRKCFELLEKNNLYMKMSKCEFGKNIWYIWATFEEMVN